MAELEEARYGARVEPEVLQERLRFAEHQSIADSFKASPAWTDIVIGTTGSRL